MYGEKVKVSLFERDRVGADEFIVSREVQITDNKACVVFPMQELLPKLYSLRSAWFEGDNFDLIALVEPANSNILKKESVAPLYLEIDKRSYTPAKSTHDGTRKFVIGDAKSEEKEEEEKKDEKCFCGKEHIDLRDKVAYQTQFDPRFGTKAQQDVACYKACRVILTNAGLSPNSAPNDSTVIQIALENSSTDKSTQSTYLTINSTKAIDGLNYINEQLETGYPVLVGVDYKSGSPNSDKTTDHFIVIVGRGCSNSEIYYFFYEVGTPQEENGIYKGANDGNKLYLKEDKTLRRAPYYRSSRNYIVRVCLKILFITI